MSVSTVEAIIPQLSPVSGLAELLLEDPDHVAAPQHAHAVGGLRAGQEPLAEPLLLGDAQQRPRPGLLLDGDRVDPAVAVGVRPALHEPPAASEHQRDRLGLAAVESQGRGPVAVALLGVLLRIDPPLQLSPIPVPSLAHIHGQPPCRPHCHSSDALAQRTSAEQRAKIRRDPYERRNRHDEMAQTIEQIGGDRRGPSELGIDAQRLRAWMAGGCRGRRLRGGAQRNSR